MSIQMVKVHPEGVIMVENSAETLGVDLKNGSQRHRFNIYLNHGTEEIKRVSKILF